MQIADATTETDQATALPNGTIEFEHRFRPVRVERDGDWVPVDTTLQLQADGSVAPKAAAAEVTFSGGGTDPMVSVENNDGEVALSSPWGALPAPVLAGNTATYREVRPGIDLRLTADVDGFSQVFVVKTRKAAKDPALSKLNFEMETDGLAVSTNKTGSLKVVDEETGRLALTASTPVMWDSDTTPGTASVAAASAETMSDGDKARMPVTVGDDTLSITPDQKMLDAPATKFPVYVDPSFTTYRTGFVMVTASNPTSTYFNTTDDALVGSNNGVNKWRTFFNFSTATAPFVGKLVQSADLRLQEKWSGSCTPTPFDAYATYAATSATTWNNQPTWSTKQDTQTVAKGYSTSGMGGASACPAGEVRMNITPITQQAAGNGGNISIGLKSPDETKVSHWKRFENNPKISVIYNSPPQLVSQQTDSTGKCVTGTSRPSLAATTPTLRATYSDADSTSTAPTTVTTTFEWWALSGSAAIGSGVQSSVRAGTSSAVAVPAGQLVGGNSYKWRVKASDGASTTGWSSWCEFSVASPTLMLMGRVINATSPCVTGASRPSVDTITPLLQAQYNSPTDSIVDVTFEFQNLDGTYVGTETAFENPVANAAAIVVPEDLMTSGEAYRWRVKATSPSGLTSGWSGFCEFVIRANFLSGWVPGTPQNGPVPMDTPSSGSVNNGVPGNEIVVSDNGDSLPTEDQAEALGDVDEVYDESSVEEIYQPSTLSDPALSAPAATTVGGAFAMSAQAVGECFDGAPVSGSGDALCETPGSAEQIAMSDAEDEALAAEMPEINADADTSGQMQAFAVQSKQPPRICLGRTNALRMTRFESCFKENRTILTWTGKKNTGWINVSIYRYTHTKSNSRAWEFNVYLKTTASSESAVGKLSAYAEIKRSDCTEHCRINIKKSGGSVWKTGAFVSLKTVVEAKTLNRWDRATMRGSTTVTIKAPAIPNTLWFERTYQSTSVRCDYATASARLAPGCVLPDYVPPFIVKRTGTKPLPALAAHIRAAQLNGLMGSPQCQYWRVQDGSCVGDDMALHREMDKGISDANREKACPKSLKRPEGMSCDEYPMASTVEGAANPWMPWWGQRIYKGCQMGTPTVNTGSDGWSACFIDHTQNITGGGLQSAFYESGNRVLNHDEFFVVVD